MVYYYFTLREMPVLSVSIFRRQKGRQKCGFCWFGFLCVSSFSVFRQQQTYLNITDFGTRIVNTKYWLVE